MLEVKSWFLNIIFSFDQYKSNKVFHERVEQSIRGDDCNTKACISCFLFFFFLLVISL